MLIYKHVSYNHNVTRIHEMQNSLSLISSKKTELQGMATKEIEPRNNNMNNFGCLWGIEAVPNCLVQGFRASRTGT